MYRLLTGAATGSWRGLDFVSLDAQALHLRPQGTRRHTQNLGGTTITGDLPVGLAQHIDDVASLHRLKVSLCVRRRAGNALAGVLAERPWQLEDVAAICRYQRALDDALQFADVPGPLVAHQLLHRARRYSVNVFAEPLGMFAHEELGE